MPPKNVNPQSLNLNSLSREAIENLLSDLYEKFDNVRNFIDLRMTGQSDPLVKKFKKIGLGDLVINI